MEPPPSRESKSCLGWFCYRSWHPFRTLRSFLLFLVVLGILFLALAALQLALYSQTHEYEVLYANHEGCLDRTNGRNCETILEIKEDMQPPITFVYFLQNAYINHRKYFDSVSPNQLAGKAIDFQTANKECTPFVTNKDMNTTHAYSGAPLDPTFVASPCGFTAKLLFNDTFRLYNEAGTQIPINESSLFPNKYGQFKRAADSESTQWSDPEGEHLMVWMQNSGSITKYKLWGRIQQVLPAGKYNLVAENNFLIGDLQIKKGALVVNPSAFGSAVYLFPILYVLMSISCFAFAVFLKLTMPDYDELLRLVDK